MSKPDVRPTRNAVERYELRSSLPMALLAVASVPVSLVPLVDMRGLSEHPWWWGAQFGLTLVFVGDLLWRLRLVERGGRVRYLRRYWIDVAAVVLPGLRLLRLGRLVKGLFALGNSRAFLMAALMLAFTGGLIAYLFERRDPSSSIRGLGDAVWWALATCTTVGYGDVVPVTLGGRLVGVSLMMVGVATFSVITAQVATRFVQHEQEEDLEPTLRALDQRLERIEAAVERLAVSRDAGVGRESGGSPP